MKCIIAGGRDFSDYNLLELSCDLYLDSITEIVSGNANGADKLGEKYAKQKNINLKIFPADWSRLGKSAGYIRNKEMGEYSDMLIAFWDGKSSGTKHMIDIAKKLGLKIQIVKY